MKKILLGSVATILIAFGAQAQELTYGGLLASYSSYTSDFGDADITVFSGEAGMTFDAFDAWVNATQVSFDTAAAPFAIDANLTTLGAGYSFGDYRVDASSSNINVGLLLPVPLGIDEIGFAYDNGTYFGRLSYAQLTPAGFTGVDNLISVHVGYAPSDALEVSFSVHAADEPTGTLDPIYILSGSYDGGAWSAELEAASVSIGGTNLNLVSLGGDYQFNSQWSAYGNYSMIDAGFVGIDTIRLGAAYNINDTVRAFADVSNITNDAGGGDIRGFSVGISMDLGDKPASYETSADRLFGVVETALAYDF